MTTRNPFPGMNPFFERRWPDAHTSLLMYIRDAVQERLPADLIASAEEGVAAISGAGDKALYRPDVHVAETWMLKDSGPGVATPQNAREPIRVLADEETDRWLEIRDTAGRVITVIELLSPGNKRNGGRDDYLRKRRSFISAGVNLVELDLVRQGVSVFPDSVREVLRDARAEYGANVFRAADRAAYEVYPIRLRERLPAIRIPLRPSDPDVLLEMQPLIDQCHERGRYSLLDYGIDPEPPFSSEDSAWVRDVLRGHGLSG